MSKIPFKILSFESFANESEVGLEAAKDKKRKAASRAQDLEDRANKNQAKYKYYDDKEKFEKKQLMLHDKIKNEQDKIQKERIRAEVNKLKQEWKIKQAKYKDALKVM